MSDKRYTRQPPLLDFRPTEKLRDSGFTPEEERILIGFCLSDNYPRKHTVNRADRDLKNGIRET